MLSVLIPTSDDEEPLAQMLPGLVKHAVTGAITEAVVLDQGSADGTQRVADVAGCRFIADAERTLGEVLGELRAPWLLVLEAGARPVGDWIDVVSDHVAAPDAGAARFRIAADPAAGWWRRLMGPRVPARTFARGFLIAQRQAIALAKPGMTLEDLPRGVAVRTLPAALVPAREPVRR